MNYHNYPDTFTFTAAYPAAGKGTVIGMLREELENKGKKVAGFEVGAMVRKHIKQKTQFGNLAKAFSSQGLRVPDDVIVPAIEMDMDSLPDHALWTIDGFPRAESQIAAYESIMENRRRAHKVIHLNISRYEAEARMELRAESAIARGETPRVDDLEPEVRANRLNDAEESIGPMVEYFESTGNLIVIDASRNIGEVMEDVRNAIFSHQSNSVHHTEHAPAQSFEHANIA